jgi:hypothetical protein
MDKLLSRALPLPDVRNPRNARAAAAVRLTCCPSVLVLLDILRIVHVENGCREHTRRVVFGACTLAPQFQARCGGALFGPTSLVCSVSAARALQLPTSF